MNFKRYIEASDTWVDSHYIMGTDTDTLTTLPADIYANDTTATVGLKGQMEQSSQPSPTTPIQPQECGERTGNLFDYTLLANDYTLNATTGLPYSFPKRVATLQPIDVSELTSVTLSYTSDVTDTMFIYAVLNGSTLVSRVAANHSGDSIDVSTGDKLYISFYSQPDNITTDKLSNIMLNSGSTAKPYEPYGYKIPILSANTTTPVYLGEVQTERKIRKLVLTGEEDWYEVGSAGHSYRITADNVQRSSSQSVVCSGYSSHYQPQTFGNIYNNRATGFGIPSTADWIAFCDPNISSVTDFKAYLQQQYSNGTPVTVWYVLATPTTGIVNEPIRKIGEYADSVTASNIPTTAGKDTFDVLTTLKPSEVSLTYTGWHDATAKEWDGSEWQ